MADYMTEAKQLDLVSWRRDLHRHPELGFQEIRTAGIVARHLGELGMEIQTGVGHTGVVGVLDGHQPGPVVMVRFDMDALPIAEETTHDFKSETPGVMHACGHDGHVAIGLGVATLLARHRQELRGSVKFVFQPAEEGEGGAMAMLKDGVLANPRPDAAFGLHIYNQLPLGVVTAGAGPVMAAAERFHCRVTGRGGHGAMPHQTVDAVVVASQIVAALQTVVSRNVNPAEMAVVTVGSFHAGSAFNIIAEQAELWGTIRTLDEATHQTVLRRVREIVEGTARAMGASAQLDIEELTVAVVNDAQAAARVRQAAARVVGAENVSDQQLWGASEDMSYFLRTVPGCFFFVGASRAEKEFPHHNPRFDFDEAVLAQGVAILCETVAGYLIE
jgi:amidohydrolase